MNLTAVDSSTLATIACDRNRELLQLEFNSRARDQYFGVPATLYEALLRAPSKGSYFNRAIRGRFRYVRISDDRAGSPAGNRR
jgi:KTSC domain